MSTSKIISKHILAPNGCYCLVIIPLGPSELSISGYLTIIQKIISYSKLQSKDNKRSLGNC